MNFVISQQLPITCTFMIAAGRCSSIFFCKSSNDILHVDGLHTYDAVKNDYETWSKFCHDDSIILFHDTLSFADSVGKFFNELDGFKLNKTDWYGLGILTKSENIFNEISTWI